VFGGDDAHAAGFEIVDGVEDLCFVFITNGPYHAMGSRIGRPPSTRKSASSSASIATVAPSRVNTAS
jgi:hypothetical protein